MLSVLTVAAWLLIQAFSIIVSFLRVDLSWSARRLLEWTIAVAVSFFGLFTGDYVHLLFCYPTYEWQVLHRTSTTEIWRFDWGGQAALAIDTVSGRSLIYDPTGAAAAAVRQGRTAPDDNNLTTTTTRLIGNWFLKEWSG